MNKFILIILIILLNINVVSARATKVSYSETQTLRTGLIGWWTFDGNRMIQNATDSSGSGNNGLLTNFAATSTVVAPGKLGQALKFDGVDDYVNVLDSNSLSFGNGTSDTPFTFSVWANRKNGGSSYNTFFSKTDTTAGSVPFEYSFGINPTGKLSITIYDNNGGHAEFITSDASVSGDIGQWTNYVATYNGNGSYAGLKLYRNGVEMSSTGSSPGNYVAMENTNRNVRIGTQFYQDATYKGFISGSMDDVRIYNRVLSPLEIKKVYNLGKDSITSSNTNSSSPLNSGLVAYWTFDGNKLISNVTDSIGTYNGTLNSFPATSTAVIAGKVGQALNFDGVDDNVVLSSDPIGTSATTISAWIKPQSFGADGAGMILWGNSTRLRINATGTRLEFTSDGFTTTAVSGSINSLMKKWLHVVVVRNSTNTVSFYVNGVLSGTINQASGTPSGSTAGKMGISETNTNKFYGAMDDIRIYNRVLSPSEIRQLYYSGQVILKP